MSNTQLTVWQSDTQCWIVTHSLVQQDTETNSVTKKNYDKVKESMKNSAQYNIIEHLLKVYMMNSDII